MRTAWLIFLALLSLSTLIVVNGHAQDEYGCPGFGGGAPSSLNTEIESSDYYIKATVVEVDDSSLNAILHVESYLTGGGGPEYILFKQASPLRFIVTRTHDYASGCYYDRTLNLGMTFYAGFQRAYDGTYVYTLAHQTLQDWLVAPIESQRTYIRTSGSSDEYLNDTTNVREIPLTSDQQLLDLVAQISGQSPAQPTLNSPYPRLANLRIETITGSHYLLPVDGSLPTLIPPLPEDITQQFDPLPFLYTYPPVCSAINCMQFTADYSLYAVKTGTDTIQFNYPYSVTVESPEGNSLIPLELEGQRFAFSDNSETLFVENNTQLNIYAISREFCDTCFNGLYIPTLELVASLPNTSIQTTLENLQFNPTGVKYDYETFQDIGAIVTGDRAISLWGQNQETTINLSAALDGAITQIEWLPPLFYFAE